MSNSINKSGFNNWVVENLKSDPELAKEHLAEVMKMRIFRLFYLTSRNQQKRRAGHILSGKLVFRDKLSIMSSLKKVILELKPL
ncbi:MAG: hypothetical protein ACJATU_000364 [Rickettsiales bacterium]|jgi:hypothetical protein